MLTGISFRHYGKLIFRRLWMILTVTALCTSITYAINIHTPPVYESAALVRVHDTLANNNNVFNDKELAQSYALLVTSPEVLKLASQRLHGVSTQQLASQVSDSPLNNTQIIQIRATATTPKLAADIANTVTQVFIKLQTDTLLIQLEDNKTKLEQNLSKAKQTLDEDRAQLYLLQESHASQDSITHQNDIISSDQINYNSLQSSYNQIQQQILQVPGTLTIVQTATPPTNSTSHTLLNTLVAATLSLLIMITFVLLTDWMDTTLKTTHDVETMTHIPALGAIPRRKIAKEQINGRTSDIELVTQDEMIKQAIVGITTYFSTYGKGKRSFLITGLQRKAGTSTVAACLAKTLAQSGMRVLLIDADLHHSSLQKVFHSSKYSSLTTLLTNQNLDTHQISNWLTQWQTHIPNLWFLPAGPSHPQTATTMLSPSLPTLIKTLLKPEQVFPVERGANAIDVIIFDTPSLDETADTLAIAATVDASLLVIKAGKAHAKIVQKVQESLRRLNAPLLGVIINYQQPKHKSYHSGSNRTMPLENGSTYEAQEKKSPALSPIAPVLFTKLAEKQPGQVAALAVPTSARSSLGLSSLLHLTQSYNKCQNS